jgi:uncharacterized protein YjaG (DUF416 family)
MLDLCCQGRQQEYKNQESMMMTVEQTPFQQFLTGMEEQLRRMPFPNQLAFAASCCERAFPNYVTFSEAQRWGDPTILRSGIDEAWKIACGTREEGDRISELESRCKAVTPNSEDFPGTDVTAAQEAAFMVTLLLQFCRERKESYAVRIATFARDTVDLYVQTEEAFDASDPDLEAKIANHPLMATELERQKADFDALKLIRASEELSHFRLRAAVVNTSNIGVPKRGLG